MNASHSNNKSSNRILSTSVKSIVFDLSILDDDTLKSIGIKPFSIKLNKTIVSKIEMKRSEQSKRHEKWNIEQNGSNKFTIQIKRKRCDDECAREMRPQKKGKFSATTANDQSKNCAVESKSFEH